MQELNERIKEQIIKYGTMAIETMIILIMPFMPPFLSKDDIRSIAIVLLTLAAPTLSIGGILNNPEFLSNLAVFCYQTTGKTINFGAKTLYYGGKTVLGIARDLLITKPLYIICYPFRNNKHHPIYHNISPSQINTKRQQIEKLKVMSSQDPDKVFFVIRSIDNETNAVQVKMVGSLKKNDSLNKIMTFINEKDKGSHLQNIQFICNKNIVNANSKISTLPTNAHGFVDLYYVKMQTFG